MKNSLRRVLFIFLVLMAATIATNAACLDVLVACYDLGGSDNFCNFLYATCLKP
jgi:hypothetical protein